MENVPSWFMVIGTYMYCRDPQWVLQPREICLVIENVALTTLLMAILFLLAALCYRAFWRRRYYFTNLRLYMIGNAIIRGTVIDRQTGWMLLKDQRREPAVTNSLIVRTAEKDLMVAADAAIYYGPPVQVGDRVTARGEYAEYLSIAADCNRNTPYRHSPTLELMGFSATHIARGTWLSPNLPIAIAIMIIVLSFIGIIILDTGMPGHDLFGP